MKKGTVDFLDHVFGVGGINRRLGIEQALKTLSIYVYPPPSIDRIEKTVSSIKEIDLCLDARGLDHVAKLDCFEVSDDWIKCNIMIVDGEIDRESVEEVLSLIVKLAISEHLLTLEVSNPLECNMFC